MKQIHKEYDRPFLLESTKLTRLIGKIHERLADHPHLTTHDHFEVFLTGDRRDELTTIEEVLALENSAKRKIRRLVVTCSASTSGAARPEHEVQVDFAGPKASVSGSISGSTSSARVVAISVRSDAAGWASRTLSEVEEQIERTWVSYWPPVLEPSGEARAFVSSAAQGQGHRTALGQVLADELGLPLEAVAIVAGDTERCPYGSGTFARAQAPHRLAPAPRARTARSA